MAIRVLLVDDQPLLYSGFRMILEAEQDIAVVGEAGDGLQAQDQVRGLQPDVVLMDIRMPRMDGVEATRQITGPERDGPAKVLVLHHVRSRRVRGGGAARGCQRLPAEGRPGQ
ncbi:Protein-glutamate methylesterase/protein-glutamine glutaminase [Streptomyces hirsutus]